MRKRHIAAAAVFTVSLAALPQASALPAPAQPTGTLFHEVVGKTQAPLREPAGSGNLAQAAIAALPDGSSQLVAVNSNGNGTLVHDIRYANGSWQGWRTPTQPGVAVRQASIAGMPNGSSQIVEVTAAGVLKHNIRNADGTWQAQGWASPAGSGGIAQASITDLPNGSSEIVAVTTDGAVKADTRNANGSWRGWSTLTPPSEPIVAAAVAGLPNGTCQVVVVTSTGKLEYNARSASGTWQAAGWTAPAVPTTYPGMDTPSGITQIAITALPNGSTEVSAVAPGDLAKYAYHNSDGSWTQWGEFYENPAVSGQPLDVSLAGMPNGTLQVIEIDQPVS